MKSAKGSQMIPYGIAGSCLWAICCAMLSAAEPVADSATNTDQTARTAQNRPLINWYSDFPAEAMSQLAITLPSSSSTTERDFAVTIAGHRINKPLSQSGTIASDEERVLHFALPMPDTSLATKQAQETIARVVIDGSQRQYNLTPQFYQQIKPSTGSIEIDADLADWQTLSHPVQQPFFGFGKEWWAGTEDSWFAFDVAMDGTDLLVAIRVRDDEVHGNAGMAPWEQDGFELRLDLREQPRPDGELVQREKGVTLIAASPAEKSSGRMFGVLVAFPEAPSSPPISRVMVGSQKYACP